jgi:hypothetical protein
MSNKTYSIQFTSPTHFGAICVTARSAREALAYVRKNYPGAVIDSFAVEVE